MHNIENVYILNILSIKLCPSGIKVYTNLHIFFAVKVQILLYFDYEGIQGLYQSARRTLIPRTYQSATELFFQPTSRHIYASMDRS